MLSSDQVLVHYSPHAPLVIAADASSYGVGAILCHIFKEGNQSVERPIMFASRTLSQAERSHSQLDREVLGIMFSIKKFNHYILSLKFTGITGRVPLVGIFKPNVPLPEFVPPRRLRWILTLACYDYNIKYKPGNAIAHADFLSRMPLSVSQPSEEVVSAGIHLFEAEDREALSSRDIATATKQDRLLGQVACSVQQ